MCGTYVLHTSHGCTLYMGNVCIGGAFEVSTTGIQVSLFWVRRPRVLCREQAILMIVIIGERERERAAF